MNLKNRNRTNDLGRSIAQTFVYNPPLYQLSYFEWVLEPQLQKRRITGGFNASTTSYSTLSEAHAQTKPCKLRLQHQSECSDSRPLQPSAQDQRPFQDKAQHR